MTNEINLFSLNAAAPVVKKEPVSSTVRSQDAEAKGLSGNQDKLEQTRQPEQGQLANTVQDLNDLAQELHRELRFTVDEDSGATVIKVVDRQTDEVIRQIPSEELLQLRQRLEEATGAIFRDTA